MRNTAFSDIYYIRFTEKVAFKKSTEGGGICSKKQMMLMMTIELLWESLRGFQYPVADWHDTGDNTNISVEIKQHRVVYLACSRQAITLNYVCSIQALHILQHIGVSVIICSQSGQRFVFFSHTRSIKRKLSKSLSSSLRYSPAWIPISV